MGLAMPIGRRRCRGGTTTSLVMGAEASNASLHNSKRSGLIAPRIEHSIPDFGAKHAKKCITRSWLRLSLVPTSTTRPVGNLKIVGGVVRRPAQRDEQVILPLRHPGLRGRLQRAPRDKERRRHDIELQPSLRAITSAWARSEIP